MLALCGSAMVVIFEALSVPVINGDMLQGPKLTKKQEKKAVKDNKRRGSKKID